MVTHKTLTSTFYLFLQQKSEFKVNIYLLKKVALTKNISQSLKLYVMCTLGEVCVDVHMQCVRITNYVYIDAAHTQDYGKNDVAVLGKTQPYDLPHLCLANFSFGFYNLDTSCSVINHFYFIKWPLRVSLVSP